MAYKVFIDGSAGTTALKIFERFKNRDDIELIRIDSGKRKDPAARAECINSSDFTFLCLPDSAAVESVSLCTNDRVCILDSSTAHRTSPGWDYGFPELSAEHRKAIARSKRVAVPGCYASGFVAICEPLVASGIMPRDYPACCHAVSGYSGGGNKAIAQYEDNRFDTIFVQGSNARSGKNHSTTECAAIDPLDSPRLYALTQQHKHLPEMMKVSGLDYPPVFSPYICDFVSGMAVTVPLTTRLLTGHPAASAVWEALSRHYEGEHFVSVAPFMGEGVLNTPFIAANALADTNRMVLYVCGNDERVSVTSVFDNLGKGASGAAVQCMNIMMGIDEGTGLE